MTTSIIETKGTPQGLSYDNNDDKYNETLKINVNGFDPRIENEIHKMSFRATQSQLLPFNNNRHNKTKNKKSLNKIIQRKNKTAKR